MGNKINFLPIMEAKREEIIEAIKQAKKETEGTMQGWHVDVELDENDIWVTGLMSCGSTSISSYKGTSLVIASIESWTSEINESEWIKNSEFYEEFQAQQEDENGFEHAFEFMNEKYPQELKKWNDEEIEYQIDNVDADFLLDEAISQYKLILEDRECYKTDYEDCD